MDRSEAVGGRARPCRSVRPEGEDRDSCRPAVPHRGVGPDRPGLGGPGSECRPVHRSPERLRVGGGRDHRPADRLLGWQGGTKVLGQNPWPSVEPLSSTAHNPRGLRRNVVGNPERNWLAWVEGGATQKEVVVAHPNGAVARTAIPVAGPEWLDVLSVDAALVYLRRCPAPIEPVELPGGDLSERPTSRTGCSIWQWSWQLRNAVLLPSGHSWVEPDGTVVQDVTRGVWAVTRPGSGRLTFASPRSGHLSDADVVVGENEGNGLSPDGRFWFSPGQQERRRDGDRRGPLAR